MIPTVYDFYVKKKMLADFQICISVPLRQVAKTKCQSVSRFVADISIKEKTESIVELIEIIETFMSEFSLKLLTLNNILGDGLSEAYSEALSVVNYLRKTLHLRYLAGFGIRLCLLSSVIQLARKFHLKILPYYLIKPIKILLSFLSFS